ncbi:MAG: OsmC family peroxiredoxin [Deltaproteobacteria bacterium]|nr:OsmC family peroxiredoxin [Deltaproteobacteria bacterium]
MKAERRAEVRWNGDLNEGTGAVTGSTSGQLQGLRVSWRARTEEPGRQCSPEELIAAAHASCFSMEFSGALAKAGTKPRHLDVTATVTFERREDQWSIVSSHLDVVGTVPGLDELAFAAMAQTAKDTCPVSRALMGNVEITVDAGLSAQDLAAAAGP